MVWRACSIRVQSTESWSKAVTPSAKLYFVRPFPGPLFNLTFNFFSSIESEISEQASRQVVTEEPEKGSSRESRNENPQRGWINYLNGLVSRSNGWVKISNGHVNRSNGWINYLNGLVSRSNDLLSRSNGWVKISNGRASRSNGWKCYCTIGLSIIRMNKLLNRRSNAWLDHGTGKVALYCFNLIWRYCQFHSHDRKLRLFQFLIEIRFLVIVWNYLISHKKVFLIVV